MRKSKRSSYACAQLDLSKELPLTVEVYPPSIRRAWRNYVDTIGCFSLCFSIINRQKIKDTQKNPPTQHMSLTGLNHTKLRNCNLNMYCQGFNVLFGFSEHLLEKSC